MNYNSRNAETIGVLRCERRELKAEVTRLKNALVIAIAKLQKIGRVIDGDP